MRKLLKKQVLRCAQDDKVVGMADGKAKEDRKAKAKAEAAPASAGAA